MLSLKAKGRLTKRMVVSYGPQMRVVTISTKLDSSKQHFANKISNLGLIVTRLSGIQALALLTYHAVFAFTR